MNRFSIKTICIKFMYIALFTSIFSINMSWADSMPKMTDTVKCASNKPDDKATQELRNKLQQQLKKYNAARFKMSDVLRAMVVDYALQGYSKKRILGYAEHFEELSQSIPNFDPDTAEYKNFDFRLGMSFASTAIFLNSTDDVSTYFKADQKNPKSNISLYVVELDKEGDAYTSLLNEVREKDAANCS